METLLSINKSLLTSLSKAGTIVEFEGEDGNLRIYEELNHLQCQERNIIIDSLFLGAHFTSGLQNFHKFLSTELAKSATVVPQTSSLDPSDPQKSPESHYNAIRARLDKTQLKYDSVIRSPSNDTWKIFQASYPVDDIFLLCSLTDEPTDSRKKSLLNDLLTVCSLNDFKLWHSSICLTLARAVSLYLAHVYHSVFGTVTSISINRGLPDPVAAELDAVEVRVESAIRRLNEKYHELKYGFLFKKGTFFPFNQPDRKSPKGYCELTAKIYATLTIYPSLDNHDRAQLIADTLRRDYPDFGWSVVVLNDHRTVEFQLAPEFSGSRVWLQRVGITKGFFTETPVFDNVIMSRGMAGYGMMLCYQIDEEEPVVQKAAVVFWVYECVLKSPISQWKEQCADLVRKWKRDRDEFDLSKKGMVYDVASWVAEEVSGSLFSVGVKVVGEDEIGINLGKTTGVTFPVCLGRPDGCVLMWPLLKPSSRSGCILL